MQFSDGTIVFHRAASMKMVVVGSDPTRKDGLMCRYYNPASGLFVKERFYESEFREYKGPGGLPFPPKKVEESGD